MNILGILFALGAFFGWGFGDFFIQKFVRKIDVWKVMFYIDLTAMIGLFPFIWKDLQHFNLFSANGLILMAASLVSILAFTLDAEALRDGKISVVEPIIGLEAPITVGLSVAIAGERLGLDQLILMLAIFIGSVLTVTIHHKQLHYHKRLLEKGVLFALVGAVSMGLTDFLIGTSGQKTSPLFAIWFTMGFMSSVIYVIRFLIRGELKSVATDFFKNPLLIIFMSLIDNFAWSSYAIAATLIPISIAVTISVSYIVITVLLGFFVNREKVQKHQFVGVGITVLAIILLSSISSN